MVVLTLTFLFNLMCAMVPCDPHYPPPIPESDPNVARNARGIGLIGEVVDNPPEPFVETKSGGLKGYMMTVESGRTVYAFEGIPYAQPPKLFRAPVPVKPWKGIRSAMKPAAECTQMHMNKLLRVTGSTDCLYLNVYSPMVSNKNMKNVSLPVIIFVHGGSFIFGAGHEYGPSYLLAENDVILITINYRLGPLGFLSTGDRENPGNWGAKDVSLAVQWVADNIAAFGGDPKKITLTGQSAGGVLVHLQMMSNKTKHLIHNAVTFSSSAFMHWAVHTPHQARKWTEKFGKIMGCPVTQGSRVLMNCLRNMNPNFLVGKQLDLYDFLMFPPILLRPVIEPDHPEAFLTKFPQELYESGEVAKIPLLSTGTREEGEFMVVSLKSVGVYRLLLNHWRTAASSIYDYRRVVPNITEVNLKLVDFYLNGTDPRKAPLGVLSDAGADRYFNVAIRKGLKAHAPLAPTYSYIFGIRSPYGLASVVWGQDYWAYGTPHGEDLTYMFNSTLLWPSIKRKDSAYTVMKLLTSMLANFAKTSEPIYTDGNGTNHHIWKRISSSSDLKFLQIDGKGVKMVSDPFSERVKFWKELNIDDTFPYERF